MKIACDVKGTLEGYKKKQVLRLLDLFSRAGYEVTIWSNLSIYAFDAVKNNNLKAEVDSKRMKSDYPYDNDETKFFNYAIEDDRSQTWLAAKNFIWVDEIPEDMKAVDLFFKELTKEE